MLKAISSKIYFHIRRSRNWFQYRAFLYNLRKKNIFIDRTVQILGARYIEIGSNSCIGEGTWINVNMGFEGHKCLFIGENSFIGRRNLIDVGKNITIGPFFLSGLNCEIIGANHKISNPYKPYISEADVDKEIVIGANCWLGSEVVVLPGSSLGNGCVVASKSLVNNIFPSFVMLAGIPGKIIKRYSFRSNKWLKVSEFDELEELKFYPDHNHYLSQLNQNKIELSNLKIACSSAGGNLY